MIILAYSCINKHDNLALQADLCYALLLLFRNEVDLNIIQVLQK